MSSKVVRAAAGAPPEWRQIGALASGASRIAEGGEAAVLRRRIAELEQALPAAVEQARQEAARAAGAESARVQAELREDLARKLADDVAGLVAVRGQMRRQMEKDLVRLAVVVARRVIRRELTVDPEALSGIARAAIEQIEAREIHRLRVAPQEADRMKRLLHDMALPEKIAVIADPSLGSGSIVLETARGTIDASVEVQLAEIDRGLADVARRIA